MKRLMLLGALVFLLLVSCTDSDGKWSGASGFLPIKPLDNYSVVAVNYSGSLYLNPSEIAELVRQEYPNVVGIYKQDNDFLLFFKNE